MSKKWNIFFLSIWKILFPHITKNQTKNTRQITRSYVFHGTSNLSPKITPQIFYWAFYHTSLIFLVFISRLLNASVTEHVQQCSEKNTFQLLHKISFQISKESFQLLNHQINENQNQNTYKLKEISLRHYVEDLFSSIVHLSRFDAMRFISFMHFDCATGNKSLHVHYLATHTLSRVLYARFQNQFLKAGTWKT